jgi:NitT/TauT family transport system substrate-binding protein
LAVVASLGNEAPAQTTSPLVRIGNAPDDAGRPLLYAAQSGLFKQAGLNVEIVKLANGSAVAAAVAGGSLELGKGSALTAIQAHAKGLPFTVTTNLANYSDASPDTAMIVRRDAKMKTPKDLIGKTIGVNGLQDFNTLTVYAWLDQNGIDSSKVRFLEIPYSAAIAAMEQGRIDAAMALEPMYSSALASGKFRVFAHPWNALGKHFSEGVLFGKTSWVTEHKDLVVKLNRVVHDAEAYVGTHETETAHLAAAYSGFDPASLKDFHPPARALALDATDLQPTIDAAARYKLIAKPFPAQDLICDCAKESAAR